MMNCDEWIQHVLRKYGGAISGWLFWHYNKYAILYVYTVRNIHKSDLVQRSMLALWLNVNRAEQNHV